jgi:hypothetical protein
MIARDSWSVKFAVAERGDSAERIDGEELRGLEIAL